MGNSLIAFGNYIDGSILSNGSYITTLPLSNIQKLQLGRVARTLNTLTASSVMDIDIGIGNIVRLFAALNHNYSIQATYRLRGSNDPTFATNGFDTGVLNVWQSVFNTDDLEWESDNFWTGQYQASDLVGYPWHLSVLTNQVLYLRYWRFEVFDVSNPSGFIQTGRIFIGDAWEPDNGVAFGCSIAWEDPTTVQTSLSSSKYFDGKPPYRVAKITTHFMELDEAYSRAFEIQRRSGIWKELFFVMDVDDTVQMLRRSFPCRQRAISAVANPYPNAHDTNWELEENTP